MKFSSTLTHAVGLGLGLSVLWLLLSGHTDPLLIGLGLASCVAIVLIAGRLDVIDHEAVPLQLHLGWFGYIGWLGREITKSNIDVARIVLSPSLPISPTMIWVPASQRTDVGKVIYANSITLTPGTVSVEIEEGEILVHAITRAAAEGLVAGEMDRRIVRVEGR
jgi:multicomponent Na+:H+ antiporter subunit E